MPIQDRADCQANFDLITRWLSSCSKHHKACSDILSHAVAFQLPTRLIDVGVTSTDQPRLVLSQDMDLSCDRRYIALSHCWGDPSKIPQTNAGNLTEHQEKITELSQTFRDAIAITKGLGVRYIWIDSLCIIQDELADFHKECAIMHLVYSGAYVILSVLDAKDGSDGLFIPRDAEAVKSAVPIEWMEALAGPLATRGWAY